MLTICNYRNYFKKLKTEDSTDISMNNFFNFEKFPWYVNKISDLYF